MTPGLFLLSHRWRGGDPRTIFPMKTRLVHLLALLGLAAPLGATSVIWVSPTGRDDAPGTQERPLATLPRAVEALRAQAKAGRTKDAVVRLREGVYRLERTLELTAAEIGDGKFPVTFMAAPGERAVIKGSRVLAGRWERVDGSLWRMAVPEARGRGAFRQLFRGEEGLRRAREPDTGFFTLKAADRTRRVATINEPLPASWASLQGVELNSTAWWHFNRQPVEQVEPESRRIVARRPIGTDASSFKFGDRGHERIWLENAREFADEPGEWALDQASGELFLRVVDGDDPNRATFSCAVLSELIVVRGEPTQLVRNVRFEGLEFAETDWHMPEAGRLGVQAGAWAFDRSRTYTPTAAVRFIYAWDVSVSKCQFRDLGEGAVAFEIGTRSGRVEASSFTRVGANVIQVGRIPEYTGDRHPLHRDFSSWGEWASRLEAYPNSQAIWEHTSRVVPEAPSRIELVGNHILDSCHIDFGSVGIWVGYANHVRIERNYLSGLPYTGINVGWRWGPGLTNCHSNLIIGNRIEGVMRQVGDGAGIYLVGEQPGTRVEGNYVRDSGGNYWAHGIYADESSDHMEIVGNYVQQVSDHSIFMNRNGLNQILRDNNGEVGPTVITGGDGKGRFWAKFSPERRPTNLDETVPVPARP